MTGFWESREMTVLVLAALCLMTHNGLLLANPESVSMMSQWRVFCPNMVVSSQDEYLILLDKGTMTNWPQTVQLSAQWTLWTVSQCVCITLCHRGFTDLSITKGKTEKTNSQDNEIHFNSKFMSRAESQKQKGSSRLQTGWTGTHWNAGRRGCCCFP